MFLSSDQIYVFLACVFLGAASGIPFTFLGTLLKVCEYKALKNVLYLVYFINLAFLYVYMGYILNFPSIRFYMPIGVLVGLFAYVKSFDYILANANKKLYNKIKAKRIKN